MGTPKPRILPWLVSKLDQGQLEGVAWLDEARTRFRIPWKHGLRQDAQVEDFGIFQAWAEASGAYLPGRDKPDLPTWKRNFRSALNRKAVLRLADDRSKDPLDPHKVYEFVNAEARDSSQLDASPETNEGGSTSDTQEDILELLNDMVLVPLPDDGALGQYPQHSWGPSLDNPIPCPNPGPSENPLKLLLVPEEQWEFEVTAFYRGHQVFQQTIFCPGGLRLVGLEAGDRTLPGQPIVLPDPGVSLTDKVVTGYVRRVLSSLGGGLALWRVGQRLCARRLGHCHAYWAVGEELLPDCEHGHEGEVPKDVDSDVFDLGPFVTDLIAFMEGSGHSPRYALWFCLGESWPQNQPWVKRLVMVKVVPTCLKALLNMARSGGASSLENTVDLHISNSQPLSLTSEQYKAYLQDLVEDMDFQATGEA
ncbi:PREDICTED: interferon regulatory factor 3 [Chinchilla lanigera]|uniref:interferon regulatory factor 3 n=1 Tax=Chinchilla lanigera TaxID=34839 RepID=UPI00038EA27E|nr:PREDICTED: interferon regulatory factor 3 [Chinchilla lanigera]XP_013364434.1 PREDICTED: interferon regulatory factor 3 [Chinchilla lanigera]XP_013364435.1 PREDICTED: interferon regulatory factor 3 [Chinchilla lanigera]XP_013364436.1 PREDICTED: interferon regulatory factor 3 [Chinchilla lanigera]